MPLGIFISHTLLNIINIEFLFFKIYISALVVKRGKQKTSYIIHTIISLPITFLNWSIHCAPHKYILPKESTGD